MLCHAVLCSVYTVFCKKTKSDLAVLCCAIRAPEAWLMELSFFSLRSAVWCVVCCRFAFASLRAFLMLTRVYHLLVLVPPAQGCVVCSLLSFRIRISPRFPDADQSQPFVGAHNLNCYLRVTPVSPPFRWWGRPAHVQPAEAA
jgi:hypothetical protein